MKKRTIPLLLLCLFLISLLTSAAFAADSGAQVHAAETTADVADLIDGIQSAYLPDYTYFVSHSSQKWVGEDNTSGDLTKPCTDTEAGNSHGRFAGLWQSNGFARFVFYRVFGTYPAYDYHCNPASLNDNVVLVGRYASSCRQLRGTTDGAVTTDSMKELFSQAKMGDLIVLAPNNLCRQSGTTMVFLSAHESGIDVYQADYTGSCAVTTDTIPYSTLASYHCVSLLRAVNYPLVDYLAPSGIVQISLSAENIPQGENVTVTWLAAKYATEYRLTISNEQGITNTYSTTETTQVLTGLAPGTYTVDIVALNDKGQSEPARSSAFTVYPMLTVTFLDHDDTVIATQRVEYGADATAPTVPSRIGHKFAGWDTGLKNITTDTTIHALYELEKYTVTFYSVGKTTRLSTQQVNYGEAAIPPGYDETNNNFGLTDGYVFTGWHIEYGSDGSDYTCVDGDMTVIATQSWDQSSLPVHFLMSGDAELQEDGKTYKVEGNLLNSKIDPISCKLIAVLKTSAGKAVKCIILNEYTIPGKTTIYFGHDIVYSEKISSIEYHAVIIRDNDKTGGICAVPVTVGVKAETTWGNWSDWTADYEADHDDVETKTQYRYRTKLTTTSSTKDLTEPWVYSHETYTWSDYSAYSSWTGSQITGSDSVYVETRLAYKWFYYACPYCGGHSYYNQHYTWTGGCGNWISDSYYRTTWGAAPYYTGVSYHGTGRYYTYNTDAGLAFCWKSWYNGSGGSTQTQYRYKTRSKIYTYHYWKWDEWTEWSDTYIAGDEVEERTIYRYRDKVDLSDPNAGTEDTSGKEYTMTGTVEVSDAGTDLNGRNATVMVYKKTNTDPTEAQLEYVGQITIGEDNSYDFTFRPKEDPSEETGDFIVALGVEGSDKLVNIGVIQPESITHTVRYYVDGEKYAEQEVVHGASAQLPTPPVKEGYTFLHWSETTTCIQADLTVAAVFQPITHTITFIDWETNEITTHNYLHGETIAYPVVPTISGTSSRVWDKQEAGITVATESMVVQSVATWKTYTVTFQDGDTTVSTQTVSHGQAATIPDYTPVMDGKVFAGWSGSGNTSWDNIVRNCTFTPLFICAETTATPEATVTSNDDGTSTVTLSCTTEGASIYYIIEDGKTGDEEAAELNFLSAANGIRLDLIQSELVESANVYTPSDFSTIVGPGFDIIGGFDDLYGATSPEDAAYSFLDHATEYTGGEIVLQPGQSIVFLSSSDGMNDSAPQYASSQDAAPTYTLTVTASNLRQYRATVEGSVSLTISGDTPTFTECQFILSLYDEYGALVDLVPITAIVAPGSNEILFEDLVIPTDMICTSAQLSIWLTDGDVTPVLEAHTIPIH